MRFQALLVAALAAWPAPALRPEVSREEPPEEGEELPLRFGDPETIFSEEEAEPDARAAEPAAAAPEPDPAVPPGETSEGGRGAASEKREAPERVRAIIASVTPGHAYPAQLGELERIGAEAVGTLGELFAEPSKQWEHRWVAAMALGAIGGSSARDALLAGLSDPLFLIRMASAKALGMLGDPAAAPPLRRLLSDPAMVVRAAAVDALAGLKDRDSVPSLLSELRAPRNFHRGRSLWVRDHLVEALAHLGDARAVGPILGLLGEESPELRLKACSALARLKPEAPPAAEPIDARCEAGPP